MADRDALRRLLEAYDRATAAQGIIDDQSEAMAEVNAMIPRGQDPVGDRIVELVHQAEGDLEEARDELMRAAEDLALSLQERDYVDAGAALLAPVTDGELSQVEVILAVLQRAVESDELTELQQAQVVAMADMIRRRQQSAEPGTTQRHEVVGPIRGALLWAMVELPQGVVAWSQIIGALHRANWGRLAEGLSQALGRG